MNLLKMYIKIRDRQVEMESDYAYQGFEYWDKHTIDSYRFKIQCLVEKLEKKLLEKYDKYS